MEHCNGNVEVNVQYYSMLLCGDEKLEGQGEKQSPPSCQSSRDAKEVNYSFGFIKFEAIKFQVVIPNF